ncbi:MAG TPA: F0F1 ATP synthase subunit B [Planctomycetota bacterium]
MPDLSNPQWQVLIWSIVVFFGLLGVLWKFAWGPLMHALEAREKGIQNRIDEAEKKHQEALARMAEYERKINAAKDDAAEIIAEGKRDVEKLKAEILAEANKESEKTLERAKHEITLAKQTAVQEIRDKVVELAAEMAEKVVAREVKPDDHRRFIQESIDQIRAMNG